MRLSPALLSSAALRSGSGSDGSSDEDNADLDAVPVPHGGAASPPPLLRLSPWRASGAEAFWAPPPSAAAVPTTASPARAALAISPRAPAVRVSPPQPQRMLGGGLSLSLRALHGGGEGDTHRSGSGDASASFSSASTCSSPGLRRRTAFPSDADLFAGGFEDDAIGTTRDCSFASLDDADEVAAVAAATGVRPGSAPRAVPSRPQRCDSGAYCDSDDLDGGGVGSGGWRAAGAQRAADAAREGARRFSFSEAGEAPRWTETM